MPEDHSQAKLFAQALYEIRLLLSAYLGTQNTGDACVRQAAHLAYALHNEALAVLEGGTFETKQVMKKLEVVDKMFGENYADRVGVHISAVT